MSKTILFKIIAIGCFIFLTSNIHSDEVRCTFEGIGSFDYEQKTYDWDEKTTFLDMTFPKVKDGELDSIRLSYGKENPFKLNLAFEEEDNGYFSNLNLPHDHKNIKLTAVYHLNSGCYSILEVSIVETKINVESATPNKALNQDVAKATPIS